VGDHHQEERRDDQVRPACRPNQQARNFCGQGHGGSTVTQSRRLREPPRRRDGGDGHGAEHGPRDLTSSIARGVRSKRPTGRRKPAARHRFQRVAHSDAREDRQRCPDDQVDARGARKHGRARGDHRNRSIAASAMPLGGQNQGGEAGDRVQEKPEPTRDQVGEDEEDDSQRIPGRRIGLTLQWTSSICAWTARRSRGLTRPVLTGVPERGICGSRTLVGCRFQARCFRRADQPAHQ